MGITSNDIAAQRAMLERGEEKRKADWKQAERERLRDTFAAAALTGLLSNIPRYQLGVIAVQAYEIADEMIAEQSRAGKNLSETVPEVSKCTERENDHDAAPDAIAESDEARTDKAATSHRRDGTGDTPVLTDEERLSVLHFSGHYAGFYGKAMHGLAMRLGLYDLPRDTPDTHATPGEGSVQDRCTLTDEEREAVEWFSHFGRPQNGPVIGKHAATLRKLLERLHT